MIDRDELKREEDFWDKVGEKWIGTVRHEDLVVGDARKFLLGSMIAFDYLIKELGDLQDRSVLDYGCGSGWFSTYLAQRGARVKGFDISTKLVELGRERAKANGMEGRVRLDRMIAEELHYPDKEFDLVAGISILHHISLQEGGRELLRVLKPGGRAVFIEPLGESPIPNAIRNYILRVHHGHIRAVDAEHPLTYGDIQIIGAGFEKVAWKEFQLVEGIARLTGDRFTEALGIRAIDRFLLRTFPGLARHCRFVVITYTKGMA